VTNTAVAQRDPVKDLQAQLAMESVKAQFSVALPAHITPDKFARVVMTAVAKNPDLAQADRRSLFNSCLEAAADGLMPNGKEAALVIFNTKEKIDGRDTWIKKVQYMPMVRGIRKLAFNSGQLKLLDAFCVHANDAFSYEFGFEPTVTHKPPKFGSDRGPIIGVYAVAETKDGERSLEVMDKAAVEKVRAVSRSKDSGPWVQWWDEMARKTVLRRLAKRLPLSEELERAIERDNALYEVEARRQIQGGTVATTAANQLAAFATAPALEHEDSAEDWSPPEVKHPLLSADGEVIFETTSSRDWLERFEQALKKAENPAGLWEVNAETAEWAADQTERGDEFLFRLRDTYLPKPQDGQPAAGTQPATAAPQDTPADEWEDELAALIAGGKTKATVTAFAEYKADEGQRIKALPPTVRTRWEQFATTHMAALKGAGGKEAK
jgi:recombination protein RecT